MGTNDEIEELYRRHAPAVLRFACGLCGNRFAAEDIVSETFVRVLTRAPTIETQTARAYLLAVARNAFLDGVRRKQPSAPLTEDMGEETTDLEARLDDRAKLAAVAKALTVLPEGERAAFLMRVDHELPYSEIAAALNISVAAAKVRVHRARLRLAAAGPEQDLPS
jgi:RNA polymerase sigma-70 factor (ECF subfamily)